MYQEDKSEITINCDMNYTPYYPSRKSLEKQKQLSYNRTPFKRYGYENNNSRLSSSTSIKAVDQTNINKSAYDNCKEIQKKSYSDTYAVDMSANNRIRDCYYFQTKQLFYVNNSFNCTKVPTEQEKIAFLNQTRESSRKTSINNNNANNNDDELLSYDEAMNDLNRKFSYENNKVCFAPNVSEFKPYENIPKMIRMNSTPYTNFNYPQEDTTMFPPRSQFIDNIEQEIKRVSSMKCPFTRYSPFHLANQLTPLSLNEENTEILSIKVKVNENEVLVFKIKRFDDLFNTIKLFCEINKIQEELIKPLIMHGLRTLNQIYQVMNYTCDKEDIMRLELIKKLISKLDTKEEE